MSENPPSKTDRREDERSEWMAAQAWESKYWQDAQTKRVRGFMRRPLWKWPVRAVMQAIGMRDYNDMPVGSDGNEWWMKQFDGYEALPPEIPNLLELGCGPYTNTRLIRECRRVRHAVCSDPLLATYLNLPRTWLRWAVRSGAVTADDHPAEECPFADNYFDVVVMTNVLEHTRDPLLCVENAIRVLAPGGCLVLGNDTLNQKLQGHSAVGHPHWFSTGWFEENVARRLSPVLKKVIPPGQSRLPGVLDGCWIYIGRKPRPPG